MTKQRIFGVAAAAAAATVLATGCQPASVTPPPASTGAAMVAGRAIESSDASITPDGRYVAFASSATIVPGFVPRSSHGASRRHIYRLDRSTGTVVPVSVSVGGGPLALDHTVGAPMASSMSDDGRYIAFTTTDPGVVAHDVAMVKPPAIDTTADVFVRDVVAGTTQRIELPGGGDVNSGSAKPRISGNGRSVAFITGATNLDAADTNALTDVYRWDRTTGASTRVTQATGGGAADKASLLGIPTNAGDVVFESRATNLGSGFSVTDNRVYTYAKDMGAGTLSLISASSTGSPIPGELLDASGNGARVLFRSASNGVPDDTPGMTVFLRDRTAGTTSVAVRTGSGTVFESSAAQISANGRFIVVPSRNTTIVPGDVDGATMDDLFVRDLSDNQKYQVNRLSTGGPGPLVHTAGFDLSDDGRTVVFGSTSAGYAPDDGTRVLRTFVQRTPLP